MRIFLACWLVIVGLLVFLGAIYAFQLINVLLPSLAIPRLVKLLCIFIMTGMAVGMHGHEGYKRGGGPLRP